MDRLALEDLQMMQHYLQAHVERSRQLRADIRHISGSWNYADMSIDERKNLLYKKYLQYLDKENEELENLSQSVQYSDFAQFMIDKNKAEMQRAIKEYQKER